MTYLSLWLGVGQSLTVFYPLLTVTQLFNPFRKAGYSWCRPSPSPWGYPFLSLSWSWTGLILSALHKFPCSFDEIPPFRCWFCSRWTSDLTPLRYPSKNKKRDLHWTDGLHLHHFARRWVLFISEDYFSWLFSDQRSIWIDFSHSTPKNQRMEFYHHFVVPSWNNRYRDFRRVVLFL